MTAQTTRLLTDFNLQRPAFIAQGACTGYVELHGGAARDKIFFPNRGEATTKAKAICADCPVAQECLDYALTAMIKHGIWGGLSEKERRRVRRERRLAVAS